MDPLAIAASAPDWTAASCGAGAIAVELVGAVGFAFGAGAVAGLVVAVLVVFGALVAPWSWWTTALGPLFVDPLFATRGGAVVVVVVVVVVVLWGVVVVVCVDVAVVVVVVLGVVPVLVGVVPVLVGVVLVPVLLGVVLTGASAGWPAPGPLGPVTVGA